MFGFKYVIILLSIFMLGLIIGAAIYYGTAN